MNDKLEMFFNENKKIALGFSGGVDSSYLLYAGVKSKIDIKPYFIKTAFQPEFEFLEAKMLCEELGVELKIIKLDVLAIEKVQENPKNRCYFCKTNLFTALKEEAIKDGYQLLIDGTNASDDYEDRPGMKALKELMVRSPLRECGMTKDMIRQELKEAGLFTWNKPSYACLATRIPSHMPITNELLQKVEQGESYLRSLGFLDFRVRVGDENTAKVQLKENQIDLLFKNRATILKNLKKFFNNVVLDLETR